MLKATESQIHTAICQYIKLQYPNIIFTSESGGMFTSPGLANRIKKQRSGTGLPDLIILEPRNGYHGLCIELKSSPACLYKKDGTLKKSLHLIAQNEILERLRSLGYFSTFAVSFEGCKLIIDEYLSK